ncbi:hypothetical protein Leryth_023545 [Lithospermum erythrorhizon]|nr:hypothetical protein Leryth_023545 [Lithospermum erythrorhizon]
MWIEGEGLEQVPFSFSERISTKQINFFFPNYCGSGCLLMEELQRNCVAPLCLGQGWGSFTTWSFGTYSLMPVEIPYDNHVRTQEKEVTHTSIHKRKRLQYFNRLTRKLPMRLIEQSFLLHRNALRALQDRVGNVNANSKNGEGSIEQAYKRKSKGLPYY